MPAKKPTKKEQAYLDVAQNIIASEELCPHDTRGIHRQGEEMICESLDELRTAVARLAELFAASQDVKIDVVSKVAKGVHAEDEAEEDAA